MDLIILQIVYYTLLHIITLRNMVFSLHFTELAFSISK